MGDWKGEKGSKEGRDWVKMRADKVRGERKVGGGGKRGSKRVLLRREERKSERRTGGMKGS